MQLLDGPWELATDPANCGRAERWFERPHAQAHPAPVPGIIQQVFPDYHGVAWYWLPFRPNTTAAAGQRYLLRFGAIDYLAEVWLNGAPVGGHEGGETPFALDVTEALIPGGENLLAVRVLKPTDEPIDGVPLQETPHRNKFVADYQPGRSYNAGGIVLPVALQIVPAVRIVDLLTRPDPATGQIDLTVTVRNDTAAPAIGQFAARIGPANSADALDSTTINAIFEAGETSHTIELRIAQPRLWDLNDPYLYRAMAQLTAIGSGGTTFAHAAAVRCGFRDFRVVDGISLPQKYHLQYSSEGRGPTTIRDWNIVFNSVQHNPKLEGDLFTIK